MITAISYLTSTALQSYIFFFFLMRTLKIYPLSSLYMVSMLCSTSSSELIYRITGSLYLLTLVLTCTPPHSTSSQRAAVTIS